MSRRRLLAASGGSLAASSPLVLAACGTTDDDVSAAREAELLNDVLAEQRGVLAATEQAAGNAPREVSAAIGLLRVQRRESTQALEGAITELEAQPASEPASSAGAAESAVEALARQLEQSIAASLEAIRDITAERREPVHRAITEDAAALAALRSVLGGAIAPDAFVFGPPAAEEAG